MVVVGESITLGSDCLFGDFVRLRSEAVFRGLSQGLRPVKNRSMGVPCCSLDAHVQGLSGNCVSLVVPCFVPEFLFLNCW